MAEKFTYDVFLVSAIEDAEFAGMVARRLRALKMKVWFEKDRESRTFDAKDARSAEKSRNMLVLWSKQSDQSDWVHAAARTGRSRDILIQTAIDDVVPRDPFHLDERIDMAGLTARKIVPGYAALAGLLGAAQGRKGLDEFVALSGADKDAWIKKHSKDPIGGGAKAAPAKKKAAPEGELYMSDWRKRTDEWAAWTVEGAEGLPYGVPSELSLIGGIADNVESELRKRRLGTLGALAMLPDDRLEELETKLNLRPNQIRKEEWVEQARELLEGKPPRAKVDLAAWERYRKNAEPAPARFAAAPVQAVAAPAPEPEVVYVEVPAAAAAAPASADHIRIGILTAILSAIALMFFFGWLFGKDERVALSNGANVCPVGEYPVMLTPRD